MEQQTLFEPEGSDLIRLAQARPLEAKIIDSISLIQMYDVAKMITVMQDKLRVCQSGGKDSAALEELCIMAGVSFESVYNVVCVDPPELVRHLKKNYPNTRFDRPSKSMWARLVERSAGPPTKMVRWCCEEYKEEGGGNCYKVIGVRAEESKARSDRWKSVVQHKKMGTMICPILYWTEEDVWKFIKMRGLKYCSLYDEGFKRLGCIGCPKASRKQRLAEFERWPKYRDGWKLAIYRWFYYWKDKPVTRGKNKGNPRWFSYMDSPEQLWDWWMEEKQEDPNQCQFGFMD